MYKKSTTNFAKTADARYCCISVFIFAVVANDFVLYDKVSDREQV
jgi:hypothetical protein